MAAREKPGPLMSKLETDALSHAFRATKDPTTVVGLWSNLRGWFAVAQMTCGKYFARGRYREIQKLHIGRRVVTPGGGGACEPDHQWKLRRPAPVHWRPSCFRGRDLGLVDCRRIWRAVDREGRQLWRS